MIKKVKRIMGNMSRVVDTDELFDCDVDILSDSVLKSAPVVVFVTGSEVVVV